MVLNIPYRILISNVSVVQRSMVHTLPVTSRELLYMEGVGVYVTQLYRSVSFISGKSRNRLG